jgi:hypothetical protein
MGVATVVSAFGKEKAKAVYTTRNNDNLVTHRPDVSQAKRVWEKNRFNLDPAWVEVKR